MSDLKTEARIEGSDLVLFSYTTDEGLPGEIVWDLWRWPGWPTALIDVGTVRRRRAYNLSQRARRRR